MSLDLSLECPTCAASQCDVNVTWNLGPMWRAALNAENAKLIEIEGMTGSQSLAKLEAALASLRADPEKFRKLNPENGWGTYEGLVMALERCSAAAVEHPSFVWRASR